MLYTRIFLEICQALQSRKPAKRRPNARKRLLQGALAMKPAPMSSSFPVVDNPLKALGSIQYCCVICTDRLSSKGVCKRHLEEQHVSPKVYECEKCAQRLPVKAKAKKHCDQCGAGVLSYTIRRQDDKKIYACEFTGKCFLSRPKYLEHLLELCETSDKKLEPDFRRKLCALLEQPGLRQHVAEICSKKYGSRHAWRDLQCSDAHVSKAIEQLDYAVVHENGTIELGKNADGLARSQNARVYLNSLLGAGTLPQHCSFQSVTQDAEKRYGSGTHTPLQSLSDGTDSGTTTPTATAKDIPQALVHQLNVLNASGVGFPSLASYSVDAGMPLSTEMKSKRHLSDQSRFYVPIRQPPGPPTTPRFPHNASNSVQHLQHSVPPTTSTTSLPFRNQGHHAAPQSVGTLSAHSQDYASYTTESMLSPDAASESTLISSYQQLEVLDPTPFGCNYWAVQQNTGNNPFLFDGNMNYGSSEPMYHYTDDTSVRNSSIATDQTYVGDLDENGQKLSTFDTMSSYSTAQYGTFFLDDDDHHDSYGMS